MPAADELFRSTAGAALLQSSRSEGSSSGERPGSGSVSGEDVAGGERVARARSGTRTGAGSLSGAEGLEELAARVIRPLPEEPPGDRPAARRGTDAAVARGSRSRVEESTEQMMRGLQGVAVPEAAQSVAAPVAPARAVQPTVPAPAPVPAPAAPEPVRRAQPVVAPRRPSGRERHDEKITVYVSPDELLGLEHARITLRGEYGVAVDRGRIVREAIAALLADLDARGPDSILVKRLSSGA